MKVFKVFLLVALTLLVASTAMGDDVESTRCNDKVIELGDSVVTVLEKCGEPTRREGGGGFNTLYYDLSTEQNIKIFHIEDEKVNSMEEIARR
jgi:hypothetical protein